MPDDAAALARGGVSEWEWFGHAAHFCASKWCLFHMATQVGEFIVSTVGDYRPGYSTDEAEEIGYKRKYETMVFKAGAVCSAPDCGCGMPSLDPPMEIDSSGYNTPADAAEGHMKMCRKYDAIARAALGPKGETDE
jgi:hypothetical protein